VLEERVAVAEAAVRRGQPADGPGLPVVGVHPADRVGDLLPVRPDVLHRGRAGAAGDAGQALQPGPALGDGAGDQLVPRLAGFGDQDAVGDRDAAGADQHDRAGPAGVGEHQVGAAAEQQQVRTGGPHRLDQLVGGGRLDQPGCRAAQPQRGQRRHRDPTAYQHRTTLCGRSPAARPRPSADVACAGRLIFATITRMEHADHPLA
jgi:hypothetical protein